MTNGADFLGVSVVLPVYFSHVSEEKIRLLRDALVSIQDQNYAGPLELLLVDDGSPEPVQNLAVQLGRDATHNVRWLRLPSNQGIVGALNYGIAAAKHPLIARMDADDLWRDGKLAAQIDQFRCDRDLTISATGMVRIDTTGAEIDQHIRPGDWEGILRFFVEGGCPFPHGSVVADKRVYQLLGGYPHDADLRHCEDYALWGTWLRFFKPAMVEKALYSYRVSDTSVSGRHGAQQQKATHFIRSRFEALNAANTVPVALPALADALGSTLFEAGAVAYHVWRFRAAVTVPAAALAPLEAILPDCLLLKEGGPVRPWRSLLGGEGEMDVEACVTVRARDWGW